MFYSKKSGLVYFKKLIFVSSSVVILFLFLIISGCVNLEQKTVLKQDGSGTMSIHYWTKMSNVSTSREMGGFSFDESKAKAKYSSANTDVLSAKMEDNLNDSTTHVKVELKFRSINELNTAMGFNKIKSSWKEGKDGMEFSYSIPEDSTNSHMIGAGSYKLIFEVEFPGEVLETNGTRDGNKIVWNRSLADLKKDLVMTATVKSEGKKCGLFGIEFPLMALAALVFMQLSMKRKK